MVTPNITFGSSFDKKKRRALINVWLLFGVDSFFTCFLEIFVTHLPLKLGFEISLELGKG